MRSTRTGAIDPEELLALGLELEGHADNLAAALAGGACLTWEGRIRRVADALPLDPVAVIPEARVDTAAARDALPASVSHEDAAFSAGRAALLGAGLAAGDPELLGAAFADRLHEPYPRARRRRCSRRSARRCPRARRARRSRARGRR